MEKHERQVKELDAKIAALNVPNMVDDLDAKINAFKQRYTDMMTSMVTRMAGHDLVPVEYKNKPKVCTAK